MKATIVEIKYGETSGLDLTLHVPEPCPPWYDGPFWSEEDAEAYDEAFKEYQDHSYAYDHLRLGNINFEYQEEKIKQTVQS